jgi:hypothetical protein
MCAYLFHGIEVCSAAYVSTRTKPEVFCTVLVCPLEYYNNNNNNNNIYLLQLGINVFTAI